MPAGNIPNHQRYLDASIKLLDPRSRELAPAGGDLGFSQGLIKGVDLASRSVTAIVSTPNVDRFEEIVEPQAFKQWLPVFQKNPVFLAGHVTGGRSGEPTVIGSWSDLRITKEGLIGTATLAETPLAEQYWQLYTAKHLRAFSVGWITHNWEMREFDLGGGVKKQIRVFTEVELVEVSAVAIPANREALVRAASALNPLNTVGGSGGGGDSGWGDASRGVAEALLNRLRGGIHQEVDKAIKESIKKELNTEPGGRLCMLVQDVVESVQGRGADGGYGDVQPGDHGGRSAGDPSIEEFKRRLKDLLD